MIKNYALKTCVSLWAVLLIVGGAKAQKASLNAKESALKFFHSKVAKRANSSDLPQVGIIEKWDSETRELKPWKDTIFRTYYTNGLVKSETERYTYSDGSYTQTDIEEFEYTGFGAISKITQFYINNGEKDTSYIEYLSYDENELPTEEVIDYYSNGTVDYTSKSRWIYGEPTQSNTYFSSTTQEEWNNESAAWVPAMRYAYTYNEDGIPTEITIYGYDSDESRFIVFGKYENIQFYYFNPKEPDLENSKPIYVKGDILGEGTLSIKAEYDEYGNEKLFENFQHDGAGDSVLADGERFEYTYTAENQVATSLEQMYDVDDKAYYNYERITYSDYFTATALALNSEITEDINLYPNPVNGILNIDNTSIGDNFIITDINGQTILKGNGHQVDMTNFANGLYLLKMSNKTYKVLKQ